MSLCMGALMDRSQRFVLIGLLWLVGLFVLAVVALILSVEYSISKNGDGEMADSIALAFGLVTVLYYSLIFFIGNLILRRMNAKWGWHLIALYCLFIFVPILALLKISS